MRTSHSGTAAVLGIIALLSLPSCAKKVEPEPVDSSATMESQREPQPADREPVVEDIEPGWQAAPAPEVEKAPPKSLDQQAAEYTSAGALRPIYFAFDKSDLTDESRRTLAANADWLRTHPEFHVLVEGHCDERGTVEYNLALGDRRASAARSYLVSLGVDSGRLQTISYGEERPADSGHSEAAWARNRRAQFVVQAP